MFRAAFRTLFLCALISTLVFAPSTALAAPVETVGSGTPASCTDAAWMAAVDAVDPGGMVVFNCGAAPFTMMVTTRVIDKEVTINGGGLITLDGQGTLQPFLVLAGGDLTLRNITIQHGDFSSGGAIYNAGSATLENVHLSENSAGRGGAIYSTGSLVIRSSRIADNTATTEGGGIYIESGTLEVSASELNNNRAQQGGGLKLAGGSADITSTLWVGNGYASAQTGGAIYNTAALTLTNNTFAGNFSEQGGGLYTTGTVTLQNNTFQINRADIGGAVYKPSGSVQSRNNLFSSSLSLDGASPSLNCDGPDLTSLGGNLSSDNSCGLEQLSDQKSVDALLSPLQDNGGPTLTHLPLAGSPAIDAGVSTGCPAQDARGITRPQGSACDVGALEVAVTNGFVVYLPAVIR